MKPLVTIELEEYEKFEKWNKEQSDKVFITQEILAFDNNTGVRYRYACLDSYSKKDMETIHDKIKEQIKDTLQGIEMNNSVEVVRLKRYVDELKEIKSKWWYKLFGDY